MNNEINNNDDREYNRSLIENYLINSRESLMITNNIMSSISRNEDRLYDLINRELNYTRNYNNNSNILFSSPFYTNQQNASFQPRQQPQPASFQSRQQPQPASFQSRQQPQPASFQSRQQPQPASSQSRQPQIQPINNPQSRRTSFTNNNRIRRNNSIINNRNIRPRYGENIRNYPNRYNGPFDNNQVLNRDFNESLISILDNMNFDSVPVTPTEEQINNACEDISFNLISNPINTSCPINLERFTNDSLITQIIFCGHCYSPDALRMWFTTNVRCPICRYDIRTYNPLLMIHNPYRRIINTNIQTETRQTSEREQVQASETESASETRRERVQASERGREPEQEPASERGREPASETEQVQASEPASEPAASETEQVLEESIFESEMNLNDENISHNISNEIFGNLQNLISQDISGGNVGMNTYSITISDPSNNDAPILDISYQLFLN